LPCGAGTPLSAKRERGRGGELACRVSVRIEVTLACVECDSRNYKTTRKPEQHGALEKKKFCKTCKKHTLHRETK
jgi:large subunit ribosomal protein L33